MASQTTAQSLANQLRFQARMGEKVLRAAGMGTASDRSGEIAGSPACCLTVRGNIADVVLTNQSWYLNALESGALTGVCAPGLEADCPRDMPGLGKYLAPRETMSAEEANEKLRTVNEAFARAVETASDNQLDTPVTTVFGTWPLRQVLLTAMVHGSLHIGQAWGILKAKGVTDDGLEALFG